MSAPINSEMSRAVFANPELECDLVMKGGVTSGVVYPYAILELARRYRFRSIGGTSAGAIAAAFAAAAEYARQTGDPDGFVRLKAHCDKIPDVLGGLFQPSPLFRPLMAALLALSDRPGRLGAQLYALGRFGGTLAIGGVAGLLVYAALLAILWGIAVAASIPAEVSWWSLAPGALVASLSGAAVALIRRVKRLVFEDLPRHNFGICSGLAVTPGGPPVLTEWIHACLQDIAFGPQGREHPLTFGDLARAGLSKAEVEAKKTAIDLRMMTTNLSLGRPHAAPFFNMDLLFQPDQWRAIFPAGVLAYLLGKAPGGRRWVSPPDKDDPTFRRLPRPADLPVVVAVRTSLSFPILVQAVPMAMRDVGARARGELGPRAEAPIVPLLFSDGGLSSNFPIHFFDALLPVRPTFALSLDAIGPELAGRERVSMPQGASQGSFAPIKRIDGLLGFAASLLDAAKDWQDQMLSVMPGQRERVVRVALTPDEGGLNLAMPREKSLRLMGYGREAGQTIVEDFRFDEHRWRRTLVAYEALERTVRGISGVWNGYGRWYNDYLHHPASYSRQVTLAQRRLIGRRLGAFAGLAPQFDPALTPEVKFPKPRGRIRVMPEV